MPTAPLILLTNLSAMFDSTGKMLAGEGWEGFTDVQFLFAFTTRLLLAAVLAAIIAYHPKSQRQIDSLESAEAPKCFILYAVVAAIIGTVVLKFGGVVGFVVFGIGGLLRFRTNVGSVSYTHLTLPTILRL